MTFTKSNERKVNMPHKTIESIGDLVYIEKHFLDKIIRSMPNGTKKHVLLQHMSKVFYKLAQAYDEIDCDDRDEAKWNAEQIDNYLKNCR